jgi:hypothetical protein
MWTGYYEQHGKQQPMNFNNFIAVPVPSGPISGNGEDVVGTFNFSGSFSSDARQVRFKKQYFGKANHAIFYQGFVVVDPPTIMGQWGFK